MISFLNWIVFNWNLPSLLQGVLEILAYTLPCDCEHETLCSPAAETGCSPHGLTWGIKIDICICHCYLVEKHCKACFKPVNWHVLLARFSCVSSGAWLFLALTCTAPSTLQLVHSTCWRPVTLISSNSCSMACHFWLGKTDPKGMSPKQIIEDPR